MSDTKEAPTCAHECGVEGEHCTCVCALCGAKKAISDSWTTGTWNIVEDTKEARELRDPTPAELASPRFNAVWNAIKKWDISRESNGLYAGATGTDVCTILDAIDSAGLASAANRERELREALEHYFHAEHYERGNFDYPERMAYLRKRVEAALRGENKP